jgi:hypothetical protein
MAARLARSVIAFMIAFTIMLGVEGTKYVLENQDIDLGRIAKWLFVLVRNI